MAYPKRKGQLIQGDHSWISAPTLESAQILLAEPRFRGDIFLGQIFLASQPSKILSNKLSHVHAKLLDPIHTISLSTIICINLTKEARMSATAFIPSASDNTIFGLEIRNREAEKVIGNYASNHRWLDVGVGLAGLFVPGGSIVAMVGVIAAQGPLFYKPMAAKLANIYTAPLDHHTNRIVEEAMLEGANWYIANQFTVAFFTEIASELVSELGWGAAASFIPVVGGLVGAALDAVVASTMTWRVGTMVSVYFQNGGSWLGSRRETFEVAKDFVGPLSARTTNRVDLDDVAKKHRQLLERQFSTLRTVLLDSLIEMSSSEEQIMKTLEGRHLSDELIAASRIYVKEALKNKRATPFDT